MAEMTTDAAALSAAAVEFDGISSFFLFEDSASESGAGMQDTEKGVTGMFAMTGDAGGETAQKLASIWGGSGSQAYLGTQQRWDSTAEAATNFDRISGDLKGAIGQVDAADKQIQELNTISENINRSGTPYQSAADDAASSLQGSMGFTPPDDAFDLKAMEAGEAASDSLKYNFGAIEGAASAVQGSYDGDGKDDLATYQPDTHDGGDGGLLFGDGGNGGIPATLAEWALLLA